MKKLFNRIICLVIILCSFVNINILANIENENDPMYEIGMKRDLLVLMLAYPGYISSIEKDSKELVYIVMNNGKKILYDDKVKKTYDEKLNNPDLQDMLEEVYPLHSIDKVLPKNVDPGRVRVYSFFNEVYGSGEQTVRKNLGVYSTNYGNIQFNKQNNAGEQLKKAFEEVTNLVRQNPKVGGYVSPLNGTFNYRYVQGTGRLSAHAYGIAIDLVRDNADFWKWVDEEKGSKRIASYPDELVKIFENHGFVWGGKWAHFDILHYEYRPEIILKARYFGENNNLTEIDNWYDGVEITDEVKSIIEFIDEKLS